MEHAFDPHRTRQGEQRVTLIQLFDLLSPDGQYKAGHENSTNKKNASEDALFYSNEAKLIP
jgi:hypothetical protein